MKLINIETHYEGHGLQRAYLTFGRKVESTGKYNGFHLSLTLPSRKLKPAMDLRTWGLTQGWFQPVLTLMVRKPRYSKWYKLFTAVVWHGEDTDLAYVTDDYVNRHIGKIEAGIAVNS